jgi:hypothetical protein
MHPDSLLESGLWETYGGAPRTKKGTEATQENMESDAENSATEGV